MLKNKPALSSLLSSLILTVYIAGVSWFMNHAQYIFGDKPGWIGGILLLSLFVFSALICGLLLLGGPLYLYFEKEKKTAFKMLSYNIIFLAAIVVIIGVALAVMKPPALPPIY